jgi:hypothetical protein
VSNKRCTLHKDKLDEFKTWLDGRNIVHRPGLGEWQVLQVLTPEYGWQCVLKSLYMPERFSVNEKLISILQKFIDETRNT